MNKKGNILNVAILFLVILIIIVGIVAVVKIKAMGEKAKAKCELENQEFVDYQITKSKNKLWVLCYDNEFEEVVTYVIDK